MSECALKIDGLAYAYHEGEPVLDGLALEVRHGECVGIAGPNGAGKTTLVMTLAGFCLPHAGRVEVLGRELRKENLAAIRAGTGFLLQNLDDQLFMPSVLEDAMIGLLKSGMPAAEAERRARETLARVGLETLADEFPGHLSAGQKRLATLAVVLAADPDLLVLDEPTLYLDPWARRRFIERLAALEHTRLIVSHDLEMLAEVCSRIVILDRGRTVCSGPPREILGDAALMAAHRLEVPYSLRGAAARPAV